MVVSREVPSAWLRGSWVLAQGAGFADGKVVCGNRWVRDIPCC